MNSLKGFRNNWILKIQSSKNDKLNNIINAIRSVQEKTFKVFKTSQLFENTLDNSLVSFVTIGSNSKTFTELHQDINNISKVNNGMFSFDIIDKNEKSSLGSSINEEDLEKIISTFTLEKDRYSFKRKIGIARKNGSIILDTDRSYLMGIINCTNDSFSEGGSLKNYKTGERMKDYLKVLEDLEKNNEFYDMIDIGGESTRPMSDEIEPNEELERVLPLLRMIKENKSLKDKIISIDTRKSLVAEITLKEGADIINDVSGGKYDNKIYQVVSKANCPYICMHMRGTPKTMSSLNRYNDIIADVINETEDNLNKCWENDILNFNIWVDPGFGFSKIGPQNFFLLNKLSHFREAFQNTMVVGTSRKSFIKKVVGENTSIGDSVITGYCIGKGVDIIRCHDVKGIKTAIQVAESIYKYPKSESS